MFDHYIFYLKNYFIFLFFYFFKFNSFFFFFCLVSLIFSDLFFLIDYYKFRLYSYNFIFNLFFTYLLFIIKKFYFLFNFLKYITYFMNLLYILDKNEANCKYSFSLLGFLQHFDKLFIYFSNLISDTTFLDSWLVCNNLSVNKINSCFLRILNFVNYLGFNVKRRAWHSFYYRFYDLLFFLKKKKDNNYFLNKFYRLFFRLVLFFKYYRFNFRKKSFIKKPIRLGVRVFL